MPDVPDLLAALQRSINEAKANRAEVERTYATRPGFDLPDAKCNCNDYPRPGDIPDPATRVLDALGREWAMQTNGGWGALGSTATADSFLEIESNYGPVDVIA